MGQWISIDNSQKKVIQISLKHMKYVQSHSKGKCKLNLEYIDL